jgi:hypothetical protein
MLKYKQQRMQNILSTKCVNSKEIITSTVEIQKEDECKWNKPVILITLGRHNRIFR